MTPELNEKMEKLADAALESEVYESGKGFLERPYTRYRFHNGFLAGAEAMFKELEELRTCPTERAEDINYKKVEAAFEQANKRVKMDGPHAKHDFGLGYREAWSLRTATVKTWKNQAEKWKEDYLAADRRMAELEGRLKKASEALEDDLYKAFALALGVSDARGWSTGKKIVAALKSLKGESV